MRDGFYPDRLIGACRHFLEKIALVKVFTPYGLDSTRTAKGRPITRFLEKSVLVGVFTSYALWRWAYPDAAQSACPGRGDDQPDGDQRRSIVAGVGSATFDSRGVDGRCRRR